MSSSNHSGQSGSGLRLAKGRTEAIPRPGQLLAHVLRQHGMSERTAAERLGICPTELRRQIAGEHRLDTERLHDALPSIAISYHLLAAELIATTHGRPVLPLTTRHLNACVAAGRAAEQTRAALADGHVDAVEARTVAVSFLDAADQFRAGAAELLTQAATGTEGK